jgi:outer membrane protein assembly factor BamB
MNRTCAAIVVVFAMTAVAADWPQWRGPDRTGLSKEKGLLQDWPKDGPKLRWKATDIGTGYSTPIVVAGRVYLQSTRGDKRGDKEVCLALDEHTGKPVWSEEIGGVGKNSGPQYPGTRSTPTFDDGHLYCLSSDGELSCRQAADGKEVWRKSLIKEFGGKVGFWAYSESVLVDGNHVICCPGGESAGIAALNKKTGEVVWKAKLPDGDIADYSSVMAIEAGGHKQYVGFLRNGVVGVDAAEGKLLWSYTNTADMPGTPTGANIMTPVILGNRIFTSGSRSGGGLIELAPDGQGVTVKEVYFDKALNPSIGGAVLIGGYLYGSSGNAIFCADFATGKVKWKEKSIGQSSLCYADGRIYARSFDTEVALIEPNPDAYREHGRFAQPDRSKIKAWPHPIVANGAMYLRDQGVLLCYDVSASK